MEKIISCFQYRPQIFAQSKADSTEVDGGDRIVCNLVFKRII